MTSSHTAVPENATKVSGSSDAGGGSRRHPRTIDDVAPRPARVTDNTTCVHGRVVVGGTRDSRRGIAHVPVNADTEPSRMCLMLALNAGSMYLRHTLLGFGSTSNPAARRGASTSFSSHLHDTWSMNSLSSYWVTPGDDIFPSFLKHRGVAW